MIFRKSIPHILGRINGLGQKDTRRMWEPGHFGAYLVKILLDKSEKCYIMYY